MGDTSPHLMICTCEKTMPLDAQAIGRACTGRITQANQLCGHELDRFRTALADDVAVTVACTQEAPLFKEVALDLAPSSALTFVNIRETGGWSKDSAAAGPKAAALIAAAAEEMPPIALVTLESEGVALVYGRDEVAIEVGQRLADRLDITVLLTGSRRCGPLPYERVSGPERQRAQRTRTSRQVPAHDRQLRLAGAVIAQPTGIWKPSQRCGFDLRYLARSQRRLGSVSRI